MFRYGMDATADPNFYAPRRCMRAPIQEIWDVAALLDQAADAHLAGDRARADILLRQADHPAVRDWLESLWGSALRNPDQWRYRRLRKVPNSPRYLPKPERQPIRMPSRAEKIALIEHYGRHCVFCGIPLIRSEVRSAFHKIYPEAVPWGRTNATQHGGFSTLWLQFDHVVPHSRGGGNALENIVITCAGCNYGRGHNTLEELGLLDPRKTHVRRNGWDGLERVLRG